MKVLKFGGTSVANSESISNVISILNNNRNDNLLIVVSALGGITNLLQECLSHKGKSTENIINKILSSNQDKVKQYKSGKDKLFGFFVGQVMKSSGGKANPQLVNEILKKKLN